MGLLEVVKVVISVGAGIALGCFIGDMKKYWIA